LEKKKEEWTSIATNVDVSSAQSVLVYKYEIERTKLNEKYAEGGGAATVNDPRIRCR